MNKQDRYHTSHLNESQFEPSSRKRVLKNLLGINRKREMDLLEKRELLRIQKEALEVYDNNHQFTFFDIKISINNGSVVFMNGLAISEM